jgi:hypothetical protein
LKTRPWNERAQLDELAGRDVQRTEAGPVALEGHVAAHADGVAPRADDVAGCHQRRRELAEPHLPLVAPDLDVDVDDVVVGRRDSAEPVVDPEPALLGGGLVVPDDSGRLVGPRLSERAGLI